MFAGAMSIFAGSGRQGIVDGVGTSASFNFPTGIAIDQSTGILFVSDHHTIRKITPQGILFFN